MKTDASGFPENVRRPGIPNPERIVSENPARRKAAFESVGAQFIAPELAGREILGRDESRPYAEIAENLARVKA